MKTSHRKRKKWNPKITINWVPFENEEERDRSYRLWVQSFLMVDIEKLRKNNQT